MIPNEFMGHIVRESYICTEFIATSAHKINDVKTQKKEGTLDHNHTPISPPGKKVVIKEKEKIGSHGNHMEWVDGI